jgi:hypothetical protein
MKRIWVLLGLLLVVATAAIADYTYVGQRSGIEGLWPVGSKMSSNPVVLGGTDAAGLVQPVRGRYLQPIRPPCRLQRTSLRQISQRGIFG